MTFDQALSAIRSAPAGPSIAAFFDFDGTLIHGYSAKALYAHRIRHHEVGLPELLHTLRAMGGDTLSEAQFMALVTRGIAGWAGRPVAEIEELGEDLFRSTIAGAVLHETWRLVRAHLRRGHTVAIATSATRFQAAPLARELGVEHLLCTELEDRDGLLTGRIAGRTLWGPGKMKAVRDFATDRGVDLADAFAYANGDEDVPFLAACGHPRAVDPQPELADVAAQRGWSVLHTKPRPGRTDLRPVGRTVATYGTLIGAGVAGTMLGVLGGDKRRGVDFATSTFGQVASVLTDVRVEVEGEANIWRQRPAVFLINHQSSLVDLIVTTRLLRGGATAVAKKEAASIPVVGKLLELADFAFIDRGDPSRAREAMSEALDRLRDGTSIVISPEGTRSYTPRIGDFKKGAFHLAMQAEVPIVPIVIRNAGELMWRNARSIRNGTVQVKVLDPIDTRGWTKSDLDATVERVREQYVELLDDWSCDNGGIP